MSRVRLPYDSHDQLRTYLADSAYNFARRLKTLNGLTPDEYIGWASSGASVRQNRATGEKPRYRRMTEIRRP